MANVLQQFVSILVGGILSLAQGIAGGIVEMAKALFLEVTEGTVTGLSIFGGLVAIFAGLAKIFGYGEYKLRKIGEGFNTNTEIITLIAFR